MAHYSVVKTRGAWRVIDREGFEVSYVDYDTKKEAEFSRRVMEQEHPDHNPHD